MIEAVTSRGAGPLLACLALFAAAAPPAAAEDRSTALRGVQRSVEARPSPSVLVKLTAPYRAATARRVARRHGLRVLRHLAPIGWAELGRARSSVKARASVRATHAGLRHDPDVVNLDGVHRGARISLASTPNDPFWDVALPDSTLSAQWHFQVTGFPAAWDIGRRGAGASVAVLDSEFDTGHPDLRGKLLPGYNASRGTAGYGTPDVRATGVETLHGTGVAGLAGAATDNDVLTSGAGWDASVLPVKIYGDGGSEGAYVASVAEGLIWAADRSPAAINMSFSTNLPNPAIQDAINRAAAKGIVLLAAAGNDGDSPRQGEIPYPAAMENVVGVGAVGPDQVIAPFSSAGPWVDVSAPGAAIAQLRETRARVEPGVTIASGTSFSAPIVAGLVALVRANRPDLTPAEVEALISGSATDLGPPGRDNQYGAGQIDAAAALRAAAAYVRPPPPVPATSLPAPPPPAQPARPVAPAAPARPLVRSSLAVFQRIVRGRRSAIVRVRRRTSPPIGGVILRVQARRVGRGRFLTVKRVRTRRDGRYAARVRLRVRGAVELRVVVPSSRTGRGSSSRRVRLRVGR